MPETKPLRIGVIGAGSIVRARHLPNLANTSAEVVAVANRREDSAREVANEFDIGQVYRDWRHVVDSPDIDAILIGTPPNMHADMTVAGLTSGKHVFCQARMATDLAAAQRMLAADQISSLTTMLCPAPHYMVVDPHVRRVLADGKTCGEIRHVVVHHAGAMFVDPDQPLHWRQRADVSGVNLLDVGIVAEYLHPWLGPVAEVAATTRTWVPERPADGDGRTAVELPDAVSVAGRFDNGVTLTALFSGAVRGARAHVTFHGTRGSLTCWPQQTTIEVDTGGEAPQRYEVPEHERGEWTVEADFVRAVAEGRNGTPSFADGVLYTAFTEALLDAAQSSRTVSVRQPSAAGVTP